MLNLTCPNCSYVLVLLKRRLKYKCALCSRLYPQKEIENKNFRIWNKKQREMDLHNLNSADKEKQEFIQERAIFRGFRLLFKERKHRIKLNKEESKQRKLEYDRMHYYQYRDKKILQNKLWRQRNREHRKEWNKQHRLKQLKKIRQQDRIQFWRKQQKVLALQRLENTQYKPSTTEIFPSVSAISLCELLRDSLDL